MRDDDLLEALRNRQLFVQLFILAVLISISANALTNLIDKGPWWLNATTMIASIAMAAIIFYKSTAPRFPAVTYQATQVQYDIASAQPLGHDRQPIRPWTHPSKFEQNLHSAFFVRKGWPVDSRLASTKNPLGEDTVKAALLDAFEYLILECLSESFAGGWSHDLELQARGTTRTFYQPGGKHFDAPTIKALFAHNPILQQPALSVPEVATIQLHEPNFYAPPNTTITVQRQPLSCQITLKNSYETILIHAASTGGSYHQTTALLKFDITTYVKHHPLRSILGTKAGQHIQWAARLARKVAQAFDQTNPAPDLAPQLIEQIQATIPETQTAQPNSKPSE